MFKSIVFLCAVLIFTPHVVIASETMGTDEITPGMKGYGKTVFSGKKIETFDVEILGVLKNWEAGNDMILIKMTGGPLERTGIIAGMSGSPVYIDDKLIGAVSHGWSYSKDAIAGVTPIRAMMDVLEIDSQNRKSISTGKNNTWSTSLNTQDSNVVAKLKSYGLLHKDEFPEIAEKYDVMGIPSLLVYKNGEKIAHLHSANAKTPEQVTDFLGAL